MSKKNILLAITQGLWFIDVHSVEQLGHNVAAVLAGEKFWSDKHKADFDFLIAEPGAGSYFSNTLNSAKPGSIAVIPISGPIMKYDNCGDAGTQTYENLIKQADANPNITGIILQIDSGGGTVAGTQSLSNVIKSVEKPIVTLAEDLMASAAYWIGSSTDYVFAATGTTRIGSIGTMISFSDMRKVWEAQGVVFHSVNATASTEKNQDIEKALKGDYSDLIKNTLDPLNAEFMNAVKANRSKANLNEKETLSGKVFTAEKALQFGLIDGIGDLNAAISKINELASGVTEQPTQKTETNINMKKITLLASMVHLIAACGATISAGEPSVDIELSEETLNNLNAALEASATIKTDLSAATEKLTLAEKAVEEKAKAISTLEASVKTLEAKVSTLNNLGATSASTDKADDLGEVEKESYKSDVDEKLAAMKAETSDEYK